MRIVINEENELNFYFIFMSYWKNFFNYFRDYNDIKMCLNNSGEGGEYAPVNLKNCKEAYYYPENNTYVCIYCIKYYILDEVTNLCKRDIYIDEDETEEDENDCWNYSWDEFLEKCCFVSNENYEGKYLLSKGDLIGCIEATENTTYINSEYNCINCSFMYVPYYSNYFEKTICQNIKGPVIKERQISYDLFNQTKDKIKAVNGKC